MSSRTDGEGGHNLLGHAHSRRRRRPAAREAALVPLRRRRLRHLHPRRSARPRGDPAPQRAIGLILLAVKLPYRDGLSLCAELRSHRPRHARHPDGRARHERRPGARLGPGGRAISHRPLRGGRVAGARPGGAAPLWPRRPRRQRGDGAGRAWTSLDLGRLSFTPASGQAVVITPTEMRLLECLMRNANAVIPRERLITGDVGVRVGERGQPDRRAHPAAAAQDRSASEGPRPDPHGAGSGATPSTATARRRATWRRAPSP